MKIIWSNFASDVLKDIFNYHKEVANIKVANKIKNNLQNCKRRCFNNRCF